MCMYRNTKVDTPEDFTYELIQLVSGMRSIIARDILKWIKNVRWENPPYSFLYSGKYVSLFTPLQILSMFFQGFSYHVMLPDGKYGKSCLLPCETSKLERFIVL